MPVNTVANAPLPVWERRWSGTYQRELAALRDAGVEPVVDADKLRQGVLVIDLIWLVDGRILPLRATYPDNFPWLRPQVELRSEPEDYPSKHCSPVDGVLCLLGRDTGQWNTSWTLARLLREQLRDALNGTGLGDPQGEPAEFWWNTYTLETSPSYCLVDSSFHPGAPTAGTLRLQCEVERLRPTPVLRACVVEARDDRGAILATMDNPCPDLTKTITVPWVHLGEAFVPFGNRTADKISDLLQTHPKLLSCKPQSFGVSGEARIMAISYPMEIGHRRSGVGWLFLFRGGKDKSAAGQKKSRLSVIRTLRAGMSDLLVRNRHAAALRGKCIVVFGLGSVGAPLALELAKNGCSELRIVDHDLVEPGNSVRWSMGVPAWGRGKIEALRSFVSEHFPSCKVVTYPHFIGVQPGDERMIDEALNGAHLTIDAMASVRVSQWIGDKCRKAGISLVTAYATPNLEGGIAATFVPGGGCPRCLEWAWHCGEIEEPPGADQPDRLIQPPGCSERTFEGASYDIQELSIHAVRMAVAAVSQPGEANSTIATLGFEGARDELRRPVWRHDMLGKHPQCGCAQGR